MSCGFEQELSAYHDGELAADRREAVEAHLRGCLSCRQTLGVYQRMSGAMAAWSGMEMRAELPARAKAEAARARQQRGALRLAEVLTGAAAAVLVWGVVGLMGQSAVHAEPAATWERAAVTLRLETHPDDADAVIVAQWTVGDGGFDEDR